MPKVERGKKGQGANTTLRHFRADNEIWLPFGEACERLDTDRSAILRQLMAWFADLPGADLPQRPDVGR